MGVLEGGTVAVCGRVDEGHVEGSGVLLVVCSVLLPAVCKKQGLGYQVTTVACVQIQQRNKLSWLHPQSLGTGH